MKADAAPLDPVRPSASRDASLAAFVVVACAAVLTTAAAIWSVGRGVSFVDEGYFLTESAHPGASVTLWAPIVRGLFGWTGLGLADLRWINVAGLGAVSAWFAVRAGRWADAEGWIEGQGRWARHEVAALVYCGSMLRFASFPLAASYNALNQAAVLAVLALTLDGRTARLRGGSPGAWRPAAIGAVVAVDAFVKAPSAAALAVVAVLCWSFAVAADGRTALRHAAAACAGGVAACGLAFVVLVSPADWYDAVTRLAPLFGRVDPEHGLVTMAARFPGEMLEAVVVAAVHYRWALAPAVAWGATLVVLRSRGRPVTARAAAVGGLALAALFVARAAWLGHFGAPLRGVVQPYLAFLVAASIVVATAAWTGRRGRPALPAAGLVVPAALVAASLAGVFGSNRHWMMYWPLYATPWFAVCAVAAFAAARVLALRWAAHGAIVGLALLAGSQTVSGMVVAPMGLAPRWLQSEPAGAFPVLAGVRVDRPTLAYLERLRELAGSADDADAPSIGLFCVHAEQAALGRRAWGGGWTLLYLSDPDLVGDAMGPVPDDVARRAVVLVHPMGAPGGAERVLRRIGLPFPEGYSLRGTVEHPWTHKPVSVWAPRP
jgi:hypothetical protein